MGRGGAARAVHLPSLPWPCPRAPTSHIFKANREQQAPPAPQLATMDSASLTKPSPDHSSSLASPTRSFLRLSRASRCMRTSSVWVVKYGRLAPAQGGDRIIGARSQPAGICCIEVRQAGARRGRGRSGGQGRSEEARGRMACAAPALGTRREVLLDVSQPRAATYPSANTCPPYKPTHPSKTHP